MERNMGKTILIIEDEIAIQNILAEPLRACGYEVVTASDGLEGINTFHTHHIDLILLDIMLPKINGYAVCEMIRQEAQTPIILLTALDTEADQIKGFDLLADDYITKPFSVTEVLARIKANIRRSTQYVSGSAKQQTILQKGGLSMNLNDYSVTQNGNKIELTAKEFEILKLLLQNQGKVYTKEQIYSLVWNDAYFGDENAVNVHISRLRNKIEKNPREPQYIITVWGIGYKFGEIKDE